MKNLNCDPMTIGIVGVAFLPIYFSVGALAALFSSFTIEVVKNVYNKLEYKCYFVFK